MGKDYHTSQYIADSLNKIIKDISPKNIITITTNNTSNIKKSKGGTKGVPRDSLP